MTTNDALESLRAELERFGESNDSAFSDRANRMFNITRDTGEFLAVLVLATGARRILEIGTSNGYSTLWLAEAAQALGGSVTTLEIADSKAALAMATFARSGLADVISLITEEAGQFLQRVEESAYDLIFLDSDRDLYAAWWSDLRRALAPGGVLVVDNATSHAAELVPLRTLVTSDAEFKACLVTVGKGEFVSVRQRAAQ
jgi:predicted O-methyltransferase YrrM